MVKSSSFRYVRAESVDDAIDHLSDFGSGAQLLAGGQSLVPLLQFRLADPDLIIDIGSLSDLRQIRIDCNGDLLCGALVTHHALESATQSESTELQDLARVAPYIGHLPIRTRGTIGGSLAHADSTAEWCLMALAMDCEIVVVGPGGQRVLDANKFFKGLFSTALAPGEIIVGLRFPSLNGSTWLEEYSRRKGDFAIVASAARVSLSPSGFIRDVRIAVGGVGNRVLRVCAAESALIGLSVHECERAIGESAKVAANNVNPISDAHASIAYRQRLVAVLVERALRKCFELEKERMICG